MKKISLLIISLYCCASLASFFVPPGSVGTSELQSGAVTTDKITNAAVTEAKLATTNEAHSSTPGSDFTTSSTSYVDVTNLTATYTPQGTRAVLMQLFGTGTSGQCVVKLDGTSIASQQANIRFMAGASVVAVFEVGFTWASVVTETLEYPGEMFTRVATSVGSPSSPQSMKVQAKVSNAAVQMTIGGDCAFHAVSL